MHHPTDRIHTTAFVAPVVEHWLEWEGSVLDYPVPHNTYISNIMVSNTCSNQTTGNYYRQWQSISLFAEAKISHWLKTCVVINITKCQKYLYRQIKQLFMTTCPITHVTDGIEDFVKYCIKCWVHFGLQADKMLFDDQDLVGSPRQRDIQSAPVRWTVLNCVFGGQLHHLHI